jgi:hypothetical protein
MNELDDKLTKLLRLAVGSDSEGEQLAALRRAIRILAADGKTAGDISVKAGGSSKSTGPSYPRSGADVYTDDIRDMFSRYTSSDRARSQRSNPFDSYGPPPPKNPFGRDPFEKVPPNEPKSRAECGWDERAAYAKEGIPLKIYETVDTVRIPFGKYEGYTPMYVVVKDAQYASWAIDNFNNERWVAFFRAALIRRKFRPDEVVDETCKKL